MNLPRLAFFDVDETLIDIKSMFSFRAFYLLRQLGAANGAQAEQQEVDRLGQLMSQGADRAAVNRSFYEVFQGHERSRVIEAADAWFSIEKERPGFFVDTTLRALRQHQEDGVGIVFVSGSLTEILRPLAEYLGVSDVLATRLEVEAGRYTGRLAAPQTIGTGKWKAANQLMLERGAKPGDCYAYGDHLSDLSLLESVGHPRVVAVDPALVEIARLRAWPLMHAASDRQGG